MPRKMGQNTRYDTPAKTRRIQFHPKYKPLFQRDLPCRYFIVTGGRGSGKSYAISTAVTAIHAQADFNSLYLRQTLASANGSIIPEFWEKASLLEVEPILRRIGNDIHNTETGYRLMFRGIQTSKGSNVAQLKSLKRVGLILVDEAQELVDEDVFDRIDLSMRDRDVRSRIILSLNPTDKDHWIHCRFFAAREIADDFNGIAGDTCYIHTTYLDNRANLDGDFLRLAEECRMADPIRYRNIFLGFWQGETEGALWTDAMIAPYRVAKPPEDLDRVVVAVDPAVTSAEGSDETGIVVAGRKRLRGETHFYVLADRSLRASPATWAAAVANAFREFEADRVIAEVNQGGDLVQSLLAQQGGRAMPFRAVRATRGKLVRAEPVASLYEHGLVHHAGAFGELECQMRTYVGTDTQRSPDRLDALVWALTALAQGGGGSFAILA